MSRLLHLMRARGSASAWIAVFASSTLVGCRSVAAEAGTGPQLAVAISADHPTFASIVQGAELALAEVNVQRRAGQRAAIRLALPPEQSLSAIQLATQWRDNDRVLGVIGPTESGATLDALPIYSDLDADGAKAVAVVSPTGSSPVLDGRSDWLFRLAPSDAAVSGAVAKYLVDSVSATRVALFYRNDSYGRDWSAGFRSAFAARGGTIVAREPYLPGVVEWDAFAALAGARQPEVILFPGDAASAGDFLRALSRARVRARFIGGDAAAGLLRSAEFPDAQVVTLYRADSARSAVGRAFAVQYRRQYGVIPDRYAAAGYDAALVLARAVSATEREATVDVASRRRAVREWITLLGRGVAAVDGASGPIAFDSLHSITDRPIRIVRAGDGVSAP
jgi:branched-chain amino acid transport system substrate-binding protein